MILAFTKILVTGSIIVMGGGPEPALGIKRFIELAGGPQAKIVVLAYPHEDVAASTAKLKPFFAGLGAKNIEAPSDLDPKVVIQALTGATGVFLSGGNQFLFQSRFPESTGVPTLIREIYAKGGAIAGTSAGASLMSEWMPGAKTSEGTDIRSWPDGTVPGIGCVKNCIFDQHFLKRNRMQRMVQNLLSRPGTWGLGVDERGWCELRAGKIISMEGQTVLFDPIVARQKSSYRLLNPGESSAIPGG